MHQGKLQGTNFPVTATHKQVTFSDLNFFFLKIIKKIMKENGNHNKQVGFYPEVTTNFPAKIMDFV
jgi:hypothetical protein